VSKEGVHSLKGKVEAIRNFPQPKNMKKLWRFLEMVNFYRRFLPNAAKILQPLDKLLYSAISAFEASSSTLLKVCGSAPSPET